MNSGQSNALILRVSPLRFGFQAVDTVFFRPGTAANIFRGAFGEIFRRIASECAYTRMFEPRAGSSALEGGNPSGFEDRPRPFVLRAASLDGRRFGAGERFMLDINVFDLATPALDHFRLAFDQLCREGLGPGRPRVELVEASELPVVRIDLAPPGYHVGRIQVAFLTPTELKSEDRILRDNPPFDALFKRARDRVTGLMTLYQHLDATNLPDLRGMGDRASAVRMLAGHFEQHAYERRSARTGQRHNLGGFTGQAEYEGDLTEFLPYLEAAWWTGVGRHTVWGNGMVRASVQHPAD